VVINEYEEKLRKLSLKFDQDSNNIKSDYERQLKEMADKLEI
jgi:outer membrane protein OmpA-like peptidoglycan-associated protein